MAHDTDPLAIFTTPPPNETPEAKIIREKQEADDKRVSDHIDEEIKINRAALKKAKSIVKVLLLGQSESGKSTTLKNFRMRYSRDDWRQERASWRAVVQLNLIRSVITIFDVLDLEINSEPPRSESPYSVSSKTLSTSLTDKHQLLKLRLGPLRGVEKDLKRRLGTGAEEIQAENSDSYLEMRATPFDENHYEVPDSRIRRTREFVVRSWKDALEGKATSPRHTTSVQGHDSNNPDEATEVIASCREDMKALWEDDFVKGILKKQTLRLEDSAGFFLNDIDRIATRDYQPSDDDVVRARLRTLGVQEYRLHLDTGAIGINDYGKEWIMYDVGGARTSRHAWLPYFEDVNAVIFLAPISCFDERLLEDPRVNRLEDSFILWRAICSSKLLKRTTMIVFLNKCDLLKHKLKRGVEVKKFLPSFGERTNDLTTVVKYLRDKFKDTLNKYSPEPRMSYIYPTTVVDTKGSADTLKSVRDGILREHLKRADFV